MAWTIYPGQDDPNGERTYGTSVLLPLTPQNNYNPKVMILGGDNPATDTTELIDLSPAGVQISASCPTYAPCWVQGPKMAQAAGGDGSHHSSQRQGPGRWRFRAR